MSSQPRILMVEDHPDVAELYQLKLQLEGYRVVVATDGLRGLELARSIHPDLIVLDVHLPKLDGLQLLAALKDDETTHDVPVVVVTEDDSRHLIEQARQLHAAAYVVKARVLPSGLSRIVAIALTRRDGFIVELGAASATQAS